MNNTISLLFILQGTNIFHSLVVKTVCVLSFWYIRDHSPDLVDSYLRSIVLRSNEKACWRCPQEIRRRQSTRKWHSHREMTQAVLPFGKWRKYWLSHFRFEGDGNHEWLSVWRWSRVLRRRHWSELHYKAKNLLRVAFDDRLLSKFRLIEERV